CARRAWLRPCTREGAHGRSRVPRRRARSTDVSYNDLEGIETGSLAPQSLDPDATKPGRPRKPKFSLLAKLAIGGTLCAIIVSRVDWHTASDSLAETGLGLVAVMFGILIALVFVSAYKWRLLLSIHGVEYSTLRLSKY